MRSILLLAFLATPAAAFSPEELLQDRNIPTDCKEGKCVVAQSDLAWMVTRDALLVKMLNILSERVQTCSGVRGV